MTTKIKCLAQPLLVATLIVTIFTYEAKIVFGFSAKLFHRNSIGSPFYDPSLSPLDIIHRAIARSVNQSKWKTAVNPVTNLYGTAINEYVMMIQIGTPPVDIYGIADTGSEIVWTQCQPACVRCTPQRTPIFNMEASSSYNKVRCNATQSCPVRSTCGSDEHCRYELYYADKSFTRGYYSTDTMIIETNDDYQPIVQITNFVFGCGYDQQGPYGDDNSGVFGLGPGPYSLVSQLGEHSMQKVSYCMVPITNPPEEAITRIHFGEDANVQGYGAVKLPMVYKPIMRNSFVTLEAFTIGTARINFTDGSENIEEGNLIFDSGSYVMYLPKLFLDKIISALKIQIPESSRLTLSVSIEPFELCYRTFWSFVAPKIVANFRGGDVPLHSHNMFIPVSLNAKCLAILPTTYVNIFGSVAQTDHVVGFDYNQNTLTVRPFKCMGF